MPIVPHTDEIFKNLLKPLKSAKRNYSMGDFQAAIAVCGSIGEALTILIWKMNDVSLNGKPIKGKAFEEQIFGYPFEDKLTQYRRLQILKAFELIDEKKYKELDEIRTIRNSYLHGWEKARDEKKDALEAIKNAFDVFKEITGIRISKDARSIIISPLLKSFLQKI